MQSEAERLSQDVERLRARIMRRDVLAVFALSLGLATALLVLALLVPESLAGRRSVFISLELLVLVLPVLGRRLVWKRWGAQDSASLVESLADHRLISAPQASALQLALGRVAAGSPEAIRLALEAGTTKLTTIDEEPLQDLRRVYRVGAWSFACVMVLTAGLVLPHHGQALWDGLQTGSDQAAAQRGLAQLRELDFVLRYPAYLNREDEQLTGSDGELEVPQGTQVELKAMPSLERKPEAAAILIDGLRVVLSVSEQGALSGQFLARRSGQYRLALTIDNEEVIERRGHGLTVIPDRPPKVTRNFPDEPLELETAKEVEFLVEAHDDHGVASAELITRMEGSADEVRHPITLKQIGANVRHQGVLDLEGLGMRPGDTLNWVVEMSDNNNVTGPGKGRSRWHRIHLFDPSRRLDELLESLDRFVASLSDRLAPLLTRSEAAEPWAKASLVAFEKGEKLAEQLADKRLNAGDLERAVKMVMKRLTEATKRYQSGQATAPAMENRMERDLLFLDDLLSKRRLGQLSRLQQEVQRERAALQRLVERYRESSDDEGLKEQIIASIRAIRRRLKELSTKMARLEKRVGREYVNRDALEQRSVNKELDNLEAMVREGRIDEALASLDAMNQALGQVEKQVEGAAERFGGKEWRETAEKGKAIQEQMRFIKDRQKRLRGGVQRMRREARKRHLKQFGGLNKLRKKLQRLLAEARGELAQMSALGSWMKTRVDGIDEHLQRADKSLAADGYLESLEVLRRAEGLLETLSYLLERRKMKAHQRQAMARVGEAIALLERLLPDEGELLNREERRRLGAAQSQQDELSERIKKLGESMNELNEMAPMFGAEAMKALQEAQGASTQATGALSQSDAPGADRAQGEVLSALETLQKQMQSGKGKGQGGGMPMPWGSGSSGGQEGRQKGKGRRSGDRVKIPEADQGVPGAWRDEIIDAWREGFAGPEKPAVDRYYRELVR